jgi:hypothetical protein
MSVLQSMLNIFSLHRLDDWSDILPAITVREIRRKFDGHHDVLKYLMVFGINILLFWFLAVFVFVNKETIFVNVFRCWSIVMSVFLPLILSRLIKFEYDNGLMELVKLTRTSARQYITGYMQYGLLSIISRTLLIVPFIIYSYLIENESLLTDVIYVIFMMSYALLMNAVAIMLVAFTKHNKSQDVISILPVITAGFLCCSILMMTLDPASAYHLNKYTLFGCIVYRLLFPVAIVLTLTQLFVELAARKMFQNHYQEPSYPRGIFPEEMQLSQVHVSSSQQIKSTN